MKIYLQLAVSITICYVLEARPQQGIDLESKDNQDTSSQYFGCIFPFQYVNPYYHDLTARTCANILGYNLNRVANPIQYRTECDCMFPFAMNYRGYCIREDQCNEWEVYGTTYASGIPNIVPDSVDNVLDSNQELAQNALIPDGESVEPISLASDEIQRSIDEGANNIECEYIFDESGYVCCCDTPGCDEFPPEPTSEPQQEEPQPQPDPQPPTQTEPMPPLQTQNGTQPQMETKDEDNIETFDSGEYPDEDQDPQSDENHEGQSEESERSEEFGSEEESGEHLFEPINNEVKPNATEVTTNSTLSEHPSDLNSTTEQIITEQLPSNSTKLEVF